MADEGKENVEAGVEATGGKSILAKIKDLFGEKIAKAFEGMLTYMAPTDPTATVNILLSLFPVQLGI
jgi:hypothetical protein